MKSESIYIAEAIKSLRPNSEFVFQNDDYSTIEWIKPEGTAPTKAQVDSAIQQIKANELEAEQAAIAAKEAVLVKLGLTADEAAALLA